MEQLLITNLPRQRLQVVANGDLDVNLELVYMPVNASWILNLSIDDFELNGLRITTSFNILSQFSKNINFGFLVDSADGNDPYYLDDFANGRCTFNLLNREEVEQASKL